MTTDKGNFGVMSIKLVDDADERFVLWESFALNEAFLNPLGSFRMTAAPTEARFNEYFKKLSKGKVIEVWVNSTLQFTGVIQTQNATLGRRGAHIAITAEGMLAAAYEASVSPRINQSLPGAVPVVDFVQKVMSPFFFGDKLKIQNKSGLNLELKSGKPISGLPADIPVKSLKGKDFKVQTGETTYGFCSRLISRLGVILKTDATGRLMLDIPHYGTASLYTLVQSKTLSAAGDYMLDGIQITDTNKGQFSEVVVRGGAPLNKVAKRGTGGKHEVDPDTGKAVLTKTTGTRTNRPYARVIAYFGKDPYDDPEFKKLEPLIMPYGRVAKSGQTSHTDLGFRHLYRSEAQYFKPKYAEDKKSYSLNNCRTYAELMFGLRRAGGFTIKCKVNRFYSTTGYLWTPNTVVRVKIDFLGINEDMWIYERTFKSSRSQGQVTELTLMPLDSLVLGKMPS